MISIKYFGNIAEKTKATEDQVQLTDSLLRTLVSNLKEKHQLNDFVFNVAVNQKMIKDIDNYELKPNDVVAFLPPFAGG
jgi:molybdopterin synthase sulfur carrier subunit